MAESVMVRHMDGRIVGREPFGLGCETATAFFPDGYTGISCVLNDETIIAVLPSTEEAISVANYAITQHGGFGSVSIFDAPDTPITHETFLDWLAG